MASKGRILVVEDEKDLMKLLRYNLRREGYDVESAGDGQAALERARKLRPDLVILDIMLPKLDGLEVLRVLRQESNVPVIMLTAKRSELDRIVGLKMGADDYVMKPFSRDELHARVDRILRRAAGRPAPAAGAGDGNGSLHIDVERHEVRVKGKPVTLTLKEFMVLKALAEAQGRVVSREALLDHAWPSWQDRDLTVRTVDQYVARLRRKLRGEKDRLVTVTRAGYQLKLERAAA